jgi:hypothetical protein
MKSDPKIIVEATSVTVNIPIACKENVPIAREYVRSKEVQELAVEKYHKNGRGITFNDLISWGIAKTKSQAQRKLKNCRQKGVLFTIEDHKPQQYYPTCIKSQILERKNVPIDPKGYAISISISIGVTILSTIIIHRHLLSLQISSHYFHLHHHTSTTCISSSRLVLSVISSLIYPSITSTTKESINMKMWLVRT